MHASGSEYELVYTVFTSDAILGGDKSDVTFMFSRMSQCNCFIPDQRAVLYSYVLVLNC